MAPFSHYEIWPKNRKLPLLDFFVGIEFPP